jgi:hypothetical protein
MGWLKYKIKGMAVAKMLYSFTSSMHILTSAFVRHCPGIRSAGGD